MPDTMAVEMIAGVVFVMKTFAGTPGDPGTVPVLQFEAVCQSLLVAPVQVGCARTSAEETTTVKATAKPRKNELGSGFIDEAEPSRNRFEGSSPA
jgi:hypothetical protein